MNNARHFVLGVAVLTLGSASPLRAQLGVGTWVRQATGSQSSMTMTVEPCCNGGRRLIYHIGIGATEALLEVRSAFDGREVPVMMGGKPSGETMAITRVDEHHLSTVVKMNGKAFGTSKATLSADGRTLTVLNEYSAPVGGQAVGKSTEIWQRK